MAADEDMVSHVLPHVVWWIYIYIVFHTDFFVVSQLISAARHGRYFKLGWKPAQLYVRLSIIPLSQLSTYVTLVIIRHYVVAFACLHFALTDTRVVNSYEELCITRVAVVNSFARVLNPRGERIYCHPQTDCFVVSKLISVARQAGRFNIYIYIYILKRSACLAILMSSS